MMIYMRVILKLMEGWSTSHVGPDLIFLLLRAASSPPINHFQTRPAEQRKYLHLLDTNRIYEYIHQHYNIPQYQRQWEILIILCQISLQLSVSAATAWQSGNMQIKMLSQIHDSRTGTFQIMQSLHFQIGKLGMDLQFSHFSLFNEVVVISLERMSYRNTKFMTWSQLRNLLVRRLQLTSNTSS